MTVPHLVLQLAAGGSTFVWQPAEPEPVAWQAALWWIISAVCLLSAAYLLGLRNRLRRQRLRCWSIEQAIVLAADCDRAEEMAWITVTARKIIQYVETGEPVSAPGELVRMAFDAVTRP